MHTFDSVSLSLPSPALHSTLNRMAISLSFTQIDTYPHAYRHSPCFCLQEYIGVKPNCLSDMMGAFAKTRPGLSDSFVNSLFLFFKSCLYLLFHFFSVKCVFFHFFLLQRAFPWSKVNAREMCVFTSLVVLCMCVSMCVLPMGLIKQGNFLRPLRPCL